MSGRRNDVGVIGLGVMGASLARNFASRGFDVIGWNRRREVSAALRDAHPEARLDVAESLPDFVTRLEPPRRIVLMVSAGDAVDAVLDALDPLLGVDDVVVDAGNSLFTDTDRRSARAEKRPWRYMGMGVSGGEEGALKGPSIMPGGDLDAWRRFEPLLVAIAASSDSGPCVAYCGRGSAGHFVKMVHNGIEYGDMQLIAETATLLRRGLGMPAEAVADVFARWNEGDLASFLIEITAQIFRVPDPEGPEGALLLDAILDRAGQKGTGRWTVRAALDLSVALPTISAAVDARVMSSQKELRGRADPALRSVPAGSMTVALATIANALYAAKIASYTQGFSLLQAASQAHGYETNLAEVARIWKAGCIIRAAFLDRVRAAFADDGSDQPLVLRHELVGDVKCRLGDLRAVVAEAATAGIPVPALSASLAWFDTLATAEGSANLIQAQRDYFGSHGYERVDAPGEAVHSDWRPGGRG